MCVVSTTHLPGSAFLVVLRGFDVIGERGFVGDRVTRLPPAASLNGQLTLQLVVCGISVCAPCGDFVQDVHGLVWPKLTTVLLALGGGGEDRCQIIHPYWRRVG